MAQSSAPDRERYAPGDVIGGKYQLIRAIDGGGMSTVWAAHNVDLDAHVAVKLLRVELTETHCAERLLREARTLARLGHPAIVRVHDCGCTTHGDPYVVMELLDGESLAGMMERVGRVSALEAVGLLLPVVDGVRVAHEAGVVHRDIKPENVFLSRAGGRVQPKVIDFGIALTDIGERHTTHGTVLGSPAYMSPEQARGELDVDARSDVWALAVVLHELVTGTTPFAGTNYNAVLRAIIDDTPPSITELGAGDPLLAAIVERGLEKDRARRYASARELGNALAQWLFSQGVEEDAAHVSLRSTWLARQSEPPVSLSPVTVSQSDAPPRNQPTLPAPAEAPRGAVAVAVAASSDEMRRSTGGLAVTSDRPPALGVRRWLKPAAALGAAALAGAFTLWLWPTSRQASSADGRASATPTAPATPEPARVTHEAPRAEAPERAAPDGGVRAEVPAEPPAPALVPAPRRPARSNAPAPEAPKKAYRPRGI